MLSELSGSGPVLLALTGRDDSLGKVNWKKIRSKIGKAAKVGAWVVAPGAMATVAAAKAAKAALMRKRAKNIERAKIERAERARKLAEARKKQIDAERAAKEAEQAAPAPEAQYETPVDQESVDESPDAPAEETEDIPETTEEGAEENEGTMGYSRSNDDYFVGSGLKATVKKLKARVSPASGQLRVVSRPSPDKKIFIIGGLALAAFIFRKQLKKAIRG